MTKLRHGYRERSGAGGRQACRFLFDFQIGEDFQIVPAQQQGNECSSLEVLVSIQSLILAREPYYNEPELEIERATFCGCNRANSLAR